MPRFLKTTSTALIMICTALGNTQDGRPTVQTMNLAEDTRKSNSCHTALVKGRKGGRLSTDRFRDQM